MEDKIVVGIREKVEIMGKSFSARMDTGAKMSSIDKKLAIDLGLGPVLRKMNIRSVHGTSERPVVRAVVNLKGKTLKASFNLADRNKMDYPILIGRNILRKGFLVDSSL